MNRLFAIIQKLFSWERKCPTCTFAEQCKDKPDKYNCHVQIRISYVDKGYFVCGAYEHAC